MGGELVASMEAPREKETGQSIRMQTEPLVPAKALCHGRAHVACARVTGCQVSGGCGVAGDTQVGVARHSGGGVVAGSAGRMRRGAAQGGCVC